MFVCSWIPCRSYTLTPLPFSLVKKHKECKIDVNIILSTEYSIIFSTHCRKIKRWGKTLRSLLLGCDPTCNEHHIVYVYAGEDGGRGDVHVLVATIVSFATNWRCWHQPIGRKFCNRKRCYDGILNNEDEQLVFLE